MALPEGLRSLFWDCDFEALDVNENRSFIIHRILDQGDWSSITWLRSAIGDSQIREWFVGRDGRGLSPRKLRFWGLILALPDDKLDEWVRQAKQSTWHQRTAR